MIGILAGPMIRYDFSTVSIFNTVSVFKREQSAAAKPTKARACQILFVISLFRELCIKNFRILNGSTEYGCLSPLYICKMC